MKKLLMMSAALLGAIAPASADDMYQKGNWTVYRTVADDGTQSCGMRTNVAGKQALFVKWFASKPDGLSIHVFKEGWQIPENTTVTEVIGFDHDEFARQDKALGGMVSHKDGSTAGVVYGRIGGDISGEFLEQFAHANKMWVAFPGGNEREWIIDMEGSREVSRVFWINCVMVLQQRTQPYASNQRPANGDLPPGPTR